MVAFIIQLLDGFPHNFSNQNSYFLYGIHLSDPEIFKNDWFTSVNQHYHFAFSWLIKFIYGTGNFETICHLGQFFCLFAIVLALLKIFQDQLKYATQTLFVYSLWRGVFGTYYEGIADTYVISKYLQPSMLSMVFFLAGFAVLRSKYFLIAGACFGLGGLFHGPFLIAFSPTIFGILFIFKFKKNDAFKVIFGMILLSLPTVFLMAAHHESAVLFEELSIMFFERAPHHYSPLTLVSAQTLIFVLLNTLATLIVIRSNHYREKNFVSTIYILSLLTTLLGITLLFVPSGKILFIDKLKFVPLYRISGLVNIFAFAFVFERMWQFLKKTIWTRWMMTVCALSAFAIAAYPAVMELPKRFKINEIMEQRKNWIAGNTKNEDIFIIDPFRIESFRLDYLRPIYIDFKSMGSLGGGVIEWKRRLNLILGRNAQHKLSSSDSEYWDALTPEHFNQTNNTINGKFLVQLKKFQNSKMSTIKPKYEDSELAIYSFPL